MAVLALSVAGAALGAASGIAPILGVSAASWGWMAGSMLGNALFAEDVQGPRLNDLRVTGTEYGQPVPWVAGSPRIAGQIIWASQKRETATSESAKGGPEVTNYTYDCDLVILLTENEIAGVSRIWSNSELVYNGTTTKSGVWSNVTIYTGAEDQMPDPIYESAVGAGNAPAYRGRGYVVIQGLQLGGGGQIPNLTFEIEVSGVVCGDVELLAPLRLDFADISCVGRSIASSNTGSFSGESYDLVIVNQSGPQDQRQGASWNISDLNNLDYYPLTIEGYIQAPETLTPTLSSVAFGVSQLDPIVFANRVVDPGYSIALRVKNRNLYLTTSPEVFIGSISSKTHVALVWKAGAVNTCRIYFDLAYYGTVTASRLDYFSIGGRSDSSGFSPDIRVNFSDWRITRSELYTGTGTYEVVDVYDGALSLPVVYSEPPVGEVCANLMGRCGYDIDDYEIADLASHEKPLRALAIGQVAPTRGTIEVLQSAWFLEASKSDRIYIRLRATTPVATIPWADLGASGDAVSDAEPLALTMANDLEIPGQIALSYPNMAGDYQTATEHSDRLLSGQESVQNIQMPLGMLPAEAKALADALLFDRVAGMTKTTVRLPLRYAYIEPGDVIEAVNFDGRSYRLRVQVKRDTLSIIELDCVLDDVGALRSASTTDGDYISVTEPVTVEQTEFEALDIPILRDADNSPGYYMAVGPVITNPDNYEWKGAQVVRSWNGTDYAELFQTTGAGILGTCSNTLGNWTGGNVYDETNALTVVTTGGELSSRTREAMQLDGTLNVAAVGSQANGWEIIRFRNATLTAENTYILTGLHRGFRGTEWAIGGHGAGEQFLLLDSALRRVTTQTSQIGLLRYIKAATFGLRLADVTAENFTDTGVALKPFAPANPVALADGADVVVSWQRRTRVSYVYGGATPSVPVGESVESYRVRIFDGSTLVRTEVVLSPEYTYAAADISSDGFASSDTITFEICQISEIVGAGYPAECEGIAP